MADDAQLRTLAAAAGLALVRRGARVATAESCTAGWLAKALTDVPGSSQWFECGYVTYSNAAKERDLAVAAGLLARHGAVSAEVVAAMARGAAGRAGVEIAVATSGVAGPGGGTAVKPVGLVCFGLARRAAPDAALAVLTREAHFAGDRDAIRRAAVACALEWLLAEVRGG